jgi:hypothetical protein
MLPDSLSRLYGVEKIDPFVVEEGKVEKLEVVVNGDKFDKVNLVFGKVLEKEDELKKKIDFVHTFGHFGVGYLFNYLRQVMDIQDKSLFKKCEEVANGCKFCCAYNIGKRGFHPLVNIIGEYPLHHIAIDLLSITKEPTDNGTVCLLVCIDSFTRFVWLFCLKDKCALSVAECLLNIITNFGFFTILQSDQGVENRNEIMKILMEKFKFEHKFCSGYNPSSNGLIERQNRTILGSILKMCREQLVAIRNWDMVIPMLNFSLNLKYNLLTRSTSFSLMFGRSPWSKMLGEKLNGKSSGDSEIVKQYTEEENNVLLKKTQKQWGLINELIYPMVKVVRDENQEKSNKKFIEKHVMKDFVVNEIVFVKRMVKKKKIDLRWLGPLKIIEKLKNGNFNIVDRDNIVIYSNCPTNHLSKCYLKEIDVINKDEWENQMMDEELEECMEVQKENVENWDEQLEDKLEEVEDDDYIGKELDENKMKRVSMRKKKVWDYAKIDNSFKDK